MKKHWSGERLETFVYNEATLEHLHRYAVATMLVGGKTVLDAACGEGYGAAFLSQHAASVTGIDLDATTIEKAKAKYKQQNLSFKTASVTQLPERENNFDMKVSFETVEHVADQDAMLRELKRVLRKDGVLLISTPDKKSYTNNNSYQNPHHVAELYEQEFKDLLGKHFQNLMFYQQSFVQCSLLVPDAGAAALEMHSGNYETLSLHTKPQAAYWLALASDAPLPQLASSFFYNPQISNMILEDEKDSVRQTTTYRVGHALLYPFKRLRNFLNR